MAIKLNVHVEINLFFLKHITYFTCFLAYLFILLLCKYMLNFFLFFKFKYIEIIKVSTSKIKLILCYINISFYTIVSYIVVMVVFIVILLSPIKHISRNSFKIYTIVSLFIIDRLMHISIF